MNDLQKEILSDIKHLEVDCPDCHNMDSDEQYTCTTCWCEGGRGKINVFQWLKDHPKAFENVR